MFCSNCGSKVRDGSKFCSACGAGIEAMENKPLISNNVESEIQQSEPIASKKSVIEEKYVPDDDIQKTFFSMKGRLNRWRYFKRTIVLGIISTFLITILEAILYDGEIPELILMLAFLYPQYCLDVRRLMDLGKKNTWAQNKLVADIYMTIFVYFFGAESILPGQGASGDTRLIAMLWIALLVSIVISLNLLFREGSKGRNAYGPDPIEGKH